MTTTPRGRRLPRRADPPGGPAVAAGTARRAPPPHRASSSSSTADAVSHGLVDDSPRERASNHEMRSCLDLVHATATAIDPRAAGPVRCLPRTATHPPGHPDRLGRQHVDRAPRARRRRPGAARRADRPDQRPHRHRPAGPEDPAPPADLVILVGQDRIYAPCGPAAATALGCQPGCCALASTLRPSSTPQPAPSPIGPRRWSGTPPGQRASALLAARLDPMARRTMRYLPLRRDTPFPHGLRPRL